jgi:hypothetical protein
MFNKPNSQANLIFISSVLRVEVSTSMKISNAMLRDVMSCRLLLTFLRNVMSSILRVENLQDYTAS